MYLRNQAYNSAEYDNNSISASFSIVVAWAANPSAKLVIKHTYSILPFSNLNSNQDILTFNLLFLCWSECLVLKH